MEEKDHRETVPNTSPPESKREGAPYPSSQHVPPFSDYRQYYPVQPHYGLPSVPNYLVLPFRSTRRQQFCSTRYHQFRSTRYHQFRSTRYHQFRSTRCHQFHSTRRHSSLNIHPWLTILHTVIHLNTIPRDTINFLI
ncbi:GSCOCG00009253001-RA-CDS [Cotesia congregata]|nr:GSCOCG00009253001-RA-CDS [Cotesia congregata]